MKKKEYERENQPGVMRKKRKNRKKKLAKKKETERQKEREGEAVGKSPSSL